MADDRLGTTFGLALGGFGPIAAAALLVPIRGDIINANVALVLVVVVVVAATTGGRAAGAYAAVISALSYNFFFTRPYLSLNIDSADDVETTVLLLLVGLLVGQLAVRAIASRSEARESRGEIARIHRMAEMAARGDDPADVLLAAQAELSDLLGLRSCRFEAPPYGSSVPRLERSGALSAYPGGTRRFAHGAFELPADGVELPVLARGQQVGRFVLEPTPGVGASLVRKVVAVALADQVGAVLSPASFSAGGPGDA